MKVNKWIKHVIFKKSLKEIELDRILDKINDGEELTQRERRFLDLYKTSTSEDLQDYVFLTDKSVYQKLNDLLEKKVKVVCNLTDDKGNIGKEIISVFINYESDIIVLKLKGGSSLILRDHFFYSIINMGDYYTLESGERFIEKSELDRDE